MQTEEVSSNGSWVDDAAAISEIALNIRNALGGTVTPPPQAPSPSVVPIPEKPALDMNKIMLFGGLAVVAVLVGVLILGRR
jgi:hypothetical protein